MQQLNTIDSLFYYMDQRGPGMSMAMMQVFAAGKKEDPVERYEKVVSRIKDAVPAIPMLHQKIFKVPGDADKPYWVAENNVDIDYHIRRMALPQPGSWEQLTEMYGQLCSLPMDMSLPLWRVYVIEGVGSIQGKALPPNSYAIITKMHHAAADGITATRVTSIIAGAPLNQAAAESHELSAVPSYADIFAKSVRNYLNSSFKLGWESLSSWSSISAWAGKSLADKILNRSDDDTAAIPDTRFNKEVSPDRLFDSISLPREELELLRKQLNDATITEVAMTIIGGALREYLIEAQELPEQSLWCVMPMSVRTEETSGNQFSFTRIPLGTDIESGVKRVTEIRKETESAKEALRSGGAERFRELSNLIPGPLLSLIFRNVVKYGVPAKLPPLANCMVSSVPGSPNAIRFGNNELVYMNGSPPIIDGCGLLFGIIGYSDNIVISMTTCKKMVPNKQLMMNCLHNSYSKLLDEVQGSRKAKTTRQKQVRPRNPKNKSANKKSGGRRKAAPKKPLANKT